MKRGPKLSAGVSPLIRSMPESKHYFLWEIVPKSCVYVCKFIFQEKQFKMGKLATKGHWYTGTKDEPMPPQLKSVDITRLLQSYSERHLKDSLFLLWSQVCLFTMAVVLGLLKSGVNIWRVEGQKSWPWKDQRDEKEYKVVICAAG